MPLDHVGFILVVLVAASLMSRLVRGRVFADESWRSFIGSILFDAALGSMAGLLLSSLIDSNIVATIAALITVLFVQSSVVKALLIDNIVGEGFVRLLYGGGSGNLYNPLDELALARKLRIEKNYVGAREVIDRAFAQPKLAPEMRDAFEREKIEIEQLLEDLQWKSDPSAS